MENLTNPLCCVLEDPLDEQQADVLAAQLKALADPIRLRALSMIATAPDGWMCGCDFPAALERSQPTISHHLSQLVAAGLIEREQRGKWAWYRVVDERLSQLRIALGENTTCA